MWLLRVRVRACVVAAAVWMQHEAAVQMLAGRVAQADCRVGAWCGGVGWEGCNSVCAAWVTASPHLYA